MLRFCIGDHHAGRGVESILSIGVEQIGRGMGLSGSGDRFSTTGSVKGTVREHIIQGTFRKADTVNIQGILREHSGSMESR
jgi:hypothetical protein